MSKLRAIGLTTLSFLITGYNFDKTILRVHILWLFRVHLRYERIIRCETRVWYNRYSVYTESLEDVNARAFIWTRDEFVFVLRTNDIKAFISRLQELAPHVKVQKLKDVNRSVKIGHKNPKT